MELESIIFSNQNITLLCELLDVQVSDLVLSILEKEINTVLSLYKRTLDLKDDVRTINKVVLEKCKDLKDLEESSSSTTANHFTEQFTTDEPVQQTHQIQIPKDQKEEVKMKPYYYESTSEKNTLPVSGDIHCSLVDFEFEMTGKKPPYFFIKNRSDIVSKVYTDKLHTEMNAFVTLPFDPEFVDYENNPVKVKRFSYTILQEQV
eukprot:Nk52_evm12s2256 gene=Nk52_evmTU12s2256